MYFHVTHRPVSLAPISVEFYIHPGMSRNQIIHTQLSHRPSNSGNAKGHPTFTPGHPTFILGAPHLHPGGTPPQPPASAFQARCSRVRRIGPCLTPTHRVQRTPPWVHLLIPAVSTPAPPVQPPRLHQGAQPQPAGIVCFGITGVSFTSLRGASSLNPRPVLSLPQPLTRQPSSRLPACPTLACPCTCGSPLPPGSGHILPAGRSAIAHPVPLAGIPA